MGGDGAEVRIDSQCRKRQMTLPESERGMGEMKGCNCIVVIQKFLF